LNDAWGTASSLTTILNKAAPDSNRQPETGAPQFIKFDDNSVVVITADKGVYRNSMSGPGRFWT